MEGDAGTSQLNPATGGQEIEALNDTEAPDDSVAEELTEHSEDAERRIRVSRMP